MAYKISVDRIEFNGSYLYSYSSYIDTSINSTIETAVQHSWHINLDLGFDLSLTNIQSVIETAVLAYATTQGYTPITSADITWGGLNLISPSILSTLTQAWSFNSTPGRSIVTTINSANGFQVSSTRKSTCSYSITINATATGLLGGASSGYVVFEICSTNSSTGANWIEIGRWTNGQSINSLLTLSSTQPIGSDIMKVVPAGYYVRLRSVNVSGTPTYTYNSGQEVLL